MRRKRVGIVFLGLLGVALGVLLLRSPSPEIGPGRTERPAAALRVDHGPEPTIGGFGTGRIWATANFWAAGGPPDRLRPFVSAGNAKNLSELPVVTSTSEVRGGEKFVAVSLEFPPGAVTDESSVDLTVTFTDDAGRSASRTMTIDRN